MIVFETYLALVNKLIFTFLDVLLISPTLTLEEIGRREGKTYKEVLMSVWLN